MAHIALYRTWRPQSFRDVVGQQHIVQTLQNSLREGRLSHAYLFSGPRGTGKTSAAKLLAKAVNCERGPAEEPCNECEACRRITEGSVIDVVEIDAASNRGVEEIRDLRDKVKYAPTEVRRKVYIIDEVHMLTTEAFNALLKTLEEPPAHVMFILATTEPHRLPATIISRCQRFDFRRMPLDEQVAHLERVCREEGIAIEKEAAQYIARLSDGGMRDALSMLDQIASFSGNQVTYATAVSMTGGIASEQFGELARAIKHKDVGQALQTIEKLMQEGKSADKSIESLLYYFRDILMIKSVPEADALTERILDPSAFAEMAAVFTVDEIFAIIDVLNHYQTEMKYSAQPQTLLEVAVMKACFVSSGTAGPALQFAGEQAADPEEMRQLKMKIAALEQRIDKLVQSGIPAAPGVPAGVTAQASAVSPVRSSSGPALRTSSVKLDGFLKAGDNPLFKQVLNKWTQVLNKVKDTKITVHAWLRDGEPVAYDNDMVLLAFNSAMHRETTEKPANRQLIEQVMSEVLGHPTKLAAVMTKDWKEAKDGAREQAPEEMRLEQEEPEPARQEWVDEAIRLFGQDLVHIKED